MNKKLSVLLGAISVSLLTSCATDIKRAEIAADTKPRDAISETEQLQELALKAQADVLAYDWYWRGQEYLEDARDGLQDEDDANAIIEDVSYAQAYFQESIIKAKNGNHDYNAILDARQMAIRAGVFTHWKSSEKIRAVDEDLRDDTDEFSKVLSAEQTAKFQQAYLETEALAVQETELGRAFQAFKQLEDKNADDLAPKTYKAAKENLLLANNMIAKSPRNPAEYNGQVYKALESTVLLQDVMAAIIDNGKQTPESAALQLVEQDRKLGRVEGNVAALGATVMSQANQISFQNAMDNVRRYFSPEEADVYQQGDKLLIRLKKINFQTGKANIPNQSQDLLTKINAIVMGLSPLQVEVQGHTDDTGSTVVNEQLSLERARNVANFLKSDGLSTNVVANGYGSSKPLASNEDASGRAVNRRVDIVIQAGTATGQRFSE